MNFFDKTNSYKDIDLMALDGLLITSTIPRYGSRKNKFARLKNFIYLCIYSKFDTCHLPPFHWKFLWIGTLKFVFYKLFENSAAQWVLLCIKIILDIAKSGQIFCDSFENDEKLKIWYYFAILEMILLHRKSHRVAEFAKSLWKTNFKNLYSKHNMTAT